RETISSRGNTDGRLNLRTLNELQGNNDCKEKLQSDRRDPRHFPAGAPEQAEYRAGDREKQERCAKHVRARSMHRDLVQPGQQPPGEPPQEEADGKLRREFTPPVGVTFGASPPPPSPAP